MAFVQSQPVQARRIPADVAHNESPLQTGTNVRIHEEPQTWILFEPTTHDSDSVTELSTASDSQPTPGRSQVSDVGSFATLPHSNADLFEGASNSAVDETELDLLDSHLPGFRHVDITRSSAPILPAHDGYGSFQREAEEARTALQARLYAFEQYNPQRIKRRRESFELAQRQLEYEQDYAEDTTRRIEQWRLESSRLLLAEVEKEANKRRTAGPSNAMPFEGGHHVTLGDITPTARPASLTGSEWHEQDHVATSRDADDAGVSWPRMSLKLLRDLMGLDESTVALVLGHSSPEGQQHDEPPQAAAQPAVASGEHQEESQDDSRWQLRMLDRLASELGSLISQLSAHPHPGAFSTYQHVQAASLPYAGLPVIPETPVTKNAPSRMSEMDIQGSAPAIPAFHPTLDQLQLNKQDLDDSHSLPGDVDNTPGTFTQQEWERDLDIKLVFRYLRDRFISSRTQASAVATSAALPLVTAQETLAKVARVRQHHPLVNARTRHAIFDRRGSVRPGNTVAETLAPNLNLHHPARPSSSCASQSARRSARRGSGGVVSRHSSRPYWDIGGSIGSGSAIGTAGPMGNWGD